jgi:glycosyltransferase involved in cell wall biosynthesis
MDAGMVLSIHGNLGEIIRKAGGNAGQVSELAEIKEYCRAFDRLWLFSHDRGDFTALLPRNCIHVRMGRRSFILWGWLKIFSAARKNKIKVFKLVSAPALLQGFGAKLAGAKTIVKYYYPWHKNSPGRLKHPFIWLLEKFLSHFADHVIAGNSDVRKMFASSGKLLPINESIGTAAFDPAKTPADKKLSRAGGTKLLYVGRLEQVKDPLTLVRAHKIAAAKIPGLLLVVCGDGPLRKACEQEAGYGVVFLGFRGDVPSLMKSCDIYVLPSAYDASPRSLMEAMCMGMPCVATRVGGVPEYLDDSCGVLVEPGKPELMAGEIVKLAADKTAAKKLGSAARKRVLEKFDLRKNLRKEIETALLVSGGKV